MPRFRHFVDRNGDEIIFSGCQCDLDCPPCNDVMCVMQRDREARFYGGFSPGWNPFPPGPIEDMTYAEAMVDAGRGHLVIP